MVRRRWSIVAAVAVVAVVAGAGVARAAEQCGICSKANSDTSSYPAKAGAMLVRGAANTLLGWTELIRQPVDEVKSGGNVVTGLGKGVGQTIRRTLGGVGEVLTFWTPKINDHYMRFSEDCPVCVEKGKK